MGDFAIAKEQFRNREDANAIAKTHGRDREIHPDQENRAGKDREVPAIAKSDGCDREIYTVREIQKTEVLLRSRGYLDVIAKMWLRSRGNNVAIARPRNPVFQNFCLFFATVIYVGLCFVGLSYEFWPNIFLFKGACTLYSEHT